MHEKIIYDMKREIDSIINWMVDLKVQHLQNKIKKWSEAMKENQMLKRALQGKENQIKDLQAYISNTETLFKKLEEDGIIKQFDDWDWDPETGHWYHVSWYVYNNLQYEMTQESW